MTERDPLEIRTATLEEVNYPARTIEVLAVPYDSWAPVEVAGRMIEESFAPGSFGAVDRRNAHRPMPVNLEHSRENWVGRVEALYPDDRAGLRAELKIRRGAQFDQVLDDAADGMYAASVGFRSNSTEQNWDTRRTRRRIVKAFLDHIALTTTPAFAGADVLAVRSLAAPAVNLSTTPNLDRVLAERTRSSYDPGRFGKVSLPE